MNRRTERVEGQGGAKLPPEKIGRQQQQLRKEKSEREVRTRLLKMIVDNETDRRREVFSQMVQR